MARHGGLRGIAGFQVYRQIGRPCAAEHHATGIREHLALKARGGKRQCQVYLEPRADAGCVLTFTDLMPDDYAPGAARTAAGWHVCLDILESLLDGHAVSAPSHEPTDRFRELYDGYIARGVPHGAPIPPVSSPG